MFGISFDLSASIIAIIVGLCVFIAIVTISLTVITSNKRLLKKGSTGDKQRDLYEEYIGTDIIGTLKKVGVDPTEYIGYCKIINVVPNYYTLVFARILGLLALAFATALVVTGNTYVGLVALIIAALVMNAPKKSAKKKAIERKRKFNDEIPRFLDMLDSALTANLPIQNAMEYTVKYLDGVLAEEMSFALAETAMGAKNWNEALFDVANKYENPNFSDFALDVSTAYSKGISVLESVRRKSAQIKDSNLLLAKENATAISNKVLVPTMIFKMIPLIAGFLLPVIGEMSNIF